MNRLETTIFRKDEILRRCRDRTVLHLGFVQHEHLYRRKIEEGDWLHGQIEEVARRQVGIDYLADVVEEIRAELGLEVLAGDVMELDRVTLDETFDVVVCGELIEHVENPGNMLRGLRRFVRVGSEIILTTPNPWSGPRLRLLRRGVEEERWLNPEHVAWYTHRTLLQMLERTGYRPLVADYYCAETRAGFLAGTEGLLGRIRQWRRLLGLRWTPRHRFDGLFFVVTPAG